MSFNSQKGRHSFEEEYCWICKGSHKGEYIERDLELMDGWFGHSIWLVLLPLAEIFNHVIYWYYIQLDVELMGSLCWKSSTSSLYCVQFEVELMGDGVVKTVFQKLKWYHVGCGLPGKLCRTIIGVFICQILQLLNMVYWGRYHNICLWQNTPVWSLKGFDQYFNAPTMFIVWYWSSYQFKA